MAERKKKKHPGRTGRPSKINPALCQSIIQGVSDGLSLRDAGILVGLCRNTARLWFERGEKEKSGVYYEFYAAVLTEQVRRKLRLLGNVESSRDWKAQWALLKRDWPDEFSDLRTVQHTGPGGGPIETKDVSAMSIAELEAIVAGEK